MRSGAGKCTVIHIALTPTADHKGGAFWMQCRKCAWIAGFPHHVPVGTGTNQITASLYNPPTLVSCVLYTAYTIIYISFLLSFWNSLKCQILPFAKKYMHLYLLITKCASIIFFAIWEPAKHCNCDQWIMGAMLWLLQTISQAVDPRQKYRTSVMELEKRINQLEVQRRYYYVCALLIQVPLL